MVTNSQGGVGADGFDNVAAALLKEYLHLEKNLAPASQKTAKRVLARYQANRARSPQQLEARRKGLPAAPIAPGAPTVRSDHTGDWLRDDQYLLRLLYKLIHGRPAHERPTALCFSGGGIRSATFCLGVLQGLAREGRLDQFRYLSSVSGGGYIASWLSRLLVQHPESTTPPDVRKLLADTAGGLTPSTDRKREPMTGSQHDAVSRLRAYSNYLSPVLGLSGDMFALVSTFLRNLVLNLCVWLPLMAALLMLPRLFVLAMFAVPPAPWLPSFTASAILLVVGGVAYMVADLPSGTGPAQPPRDRFALGCFAPVAVGAFLFSLVGVWGTGWQSQAWPPGIAAVLGAVANFVGIVCGRLLRPHRAVTQFQNQYKSAALLIGCGAVGGLSLDFALNYAHHQFGKAEAPALLYAALSLPLMLACFWAQITLCVGVTARWTDENMREWWSRASGLWLRLALGWLALFVVVFYLSPMALRMLSASLPAGAQLTAGSAALGALTSAIGYWSKNGDKLKKNGSSLLQNWGSLFLDAIAGAVLLAIVVSMSLGMSQLLQTCPTFVAETQVCTADFSARAAFVREEQAVAEPASDDGNRSATGEAAVYDFVALHAERRYTPALFVLFAAVGIVMSFAIGANAFSLHGMYGNRLVRAYLGAARIRRQPHWLTGFDPQDNIRLAELEGRTTLFPVINMALNLVQPSTSRMAWQQRKAASFTATPLYCGSVGTGYVDTNIYGGAKGMSLGRAMTISGAAASPNMGYHSSPLVTMIMTLFNVRLGWWLANPRVQFARWWKQKDFSGLRAMSAEAFSLTTDDRRSVYVSDGGHFENLGLYEMVRRRCHRIFIIDAGCDPDYQYSDLLGAVRKIRIDFGVNIELPSPLPGQPGAHKGCRLAVGTIRYSDRDPSPTGKSIDGFLYVLKPLLTEADPPDLGDYERGAPPDEGRFPQQSTADQFFNEAQFESYRVLGLHSVLDAFSKLDHGGSWPAGSSTNPWPKRRLGKPAAASAISAAAPIREASNEDSTTPESPSPSSAIAGMVQSVGPGVMLAAALTVGGTVGVVGTIKLKSSEITFSADDRKLLQALAPKTAGGAASAPKPTDGSTADLLTTIGKSVEHAQQSADNASQSASAAAVSAALAASSAASRAGTPKPDVVKPHGEPAASAPDYAPKVDLMSQSLERISLALNGYPMSASAASASASGVAKASSGNLVGTMNLMNQKLDNINKALNTRAANTTGGTNR